MFLCLFAERHHGTWKLNLDTFASLQTLIQRFVDANELLELQCLYAIQRYIKKIEFPPGMYMKIRAYIININMNMCHKKFMYIKCAYYYMNI